MTTPTRARRTQVERREESERVLLAAASEVIAERGINGASLTVIGERAGMSRGLPTHHFGSKDALVARVAGAAQDRMAGVLLAAIEQSGRGTADMSGLNLVRASIDAYLEQFEHPTADDRVLLVTWGATFPSQSSIEGMLDADRRAVRGVGATDHAGPEGRVDPGRRRPGRICGHPPRNAPRRCQPSPH